MSTKHAQLDDLKDKLQGAKRAAHMPDASKREQADLKLMEQEVTAEKLKARRPAKKKDSSAGGMEAKLDKALKDGFPGSDPVAMAEPAPNKKHHEKK